MTGSDVEERICPPCQTENHDRHHRLFRADHDPQDPWPASTYLCYCQCDAEEREYAEGSVAALLDDPDKIALEDY